MTMLKDRLEEVTGHHFNSVLANLYRDGHDSVDWHTDNEKALRRHPTIASLTFGDVRNFELRKIPPPVSNLYIKDFCSNSELFPKHENVDSVVSG